MAHVAVVGAGVAGVATAYQICKSGHEVTLVDRNPGPAEGTSRANGAQLSYAYGDALSAPSLLRHMPAILRGRDPAYRVRLQSDPAFLIWGLGFLLNGTSRRFRANTGALLQMASDTRLILQDVLAEFDLSFEYAVSGKMILYPTAAACAATADVRRLKKSMGFDVQVLDRTQATAIEPALAHYPDSVGSVVYTPDDAAARPDLFCRGLVDNLRRAYGLRTLFGTEVSAMLAHKGAVAGLCFRDREPLACDQVVVATGLASEILPWRDRRRVATWPVQGYSISARATPVAMRVSITDVKRKIVFARLGDEVRIAGLADIGPRRVRFDVERFESFKEGAIEAFGASFRHEDGDVLAPWSGGRPCTPSSRPVIQRGSLKGLYLNFGHGALGWTLCLGSARRLTEVMSAAVR